MASNIERRMVNEKEGAELLPPDAANLLREGIKNVLNIPDEALSKYAEVRVNLSWIPNIEVVLTPKT